MRKSSLRRAFDCCATSVREMIISNGQVDESMTVLYAREILRHMKVE